MNIFKKFSSFVSYSWLDLVEQEQKKSNSIQKETSTEQSNDENFVLSKPKPFHDFLRKRCRKNKKVLNDPRSPSNDFSRTPIFAETSYQEVLSPFNVGDMLEAVECALDNTINSETCLIDSNKMTNENVEQPNDFLKIDDICDWENYKFKDKTFTESLIVEVSTMNNQQDSTDTAKDKTDEIVEKSNPLSSDGECKIVACIIKESDKNENSDNFSTSTPKKTVAKLNQKPRTPLVSIANSPVTKNGSKFNRGKKVETTVGLKVKSIPKAPSTPLNPLLKRKTKTVIEFDKENF